MTTEFVPGAHDHPLAAERRCAECNDRYDPGIGDSTSRTSGRGLSKHIDRIIEITLILTNSKSNVQRRFFSSSKYSNINLANFDNFNNHKKI